MLELLHGVRRWVLASWLASVLDMSSLEDSHWLVPNTHLATVHTRPVANIGRPINPETSIDAYDS